MLFGVFRVFSGVSRASRFVRLVFWCVQSIVLCPPCFLVCSECRGVSDLFLVCSECRGVSALFSGVSRVPLNLRLVFSCLRLVFWCVQSDICCVQSVVMCLP